jgi:predicted ATP-grasp superfamily ATP-dependent carboligase
VTIVSNGKLIVAAIASRSYVEAAVLAGFDVVAIDAFADADVQSLATHCYQVVFSEGQLDRKQLFNALDDIDLRHGLTQFVGFCYGAGFEKTPNILSVINERVTVLGNTTDVVNTCKAPATFFGLCEKLQLPFPAVMHERPFDSHQWMSKVIGGSGGEHIRQLSDMQDKKMEDVYYQRFQPGMAISCLFIASESSVEVVGFSELWLDSNDDSPFRYGGAVGHVELSEQVKGRFASHVVKLSQAMGLVGINSCDAIYDGDEVYLLEVNPRLSATMGLYSGSAYSGGLLMGKHIVASQHKRHENVIRSNGVSQTSKAHQVVYAEHSLSVKDDIIWPEWACDVPKLGSRFSVGMPICTVIAEAETASLAKVMVNERALAIKSKLLN